MNDPLSALNENKIERLKLDFELGLIRTQQKEARSEIEKEMLQKQVDTIMQGYSKIFHKNMELFGDILDNIMHPPKKLESSSEGPVQGRILL